MVTQTNNVSIKIKNKKLLLKCHSFWYGKKHNFQLRLSEKIHLKWAEM